MKLLFIYLSFLCFVVSANAQQNCDPTFSPSVSIAWGLDANTQPYGILEAGIWGKNAPLGAYVGIKVISDKNDVKIDDGVEPEYSPTIIPTLSFTGKITTSSEYHFIHSPFITAGGKRYLGAGYRLYYMLGGTVMLGGELSYNNLTHANAGIIFTTAL